MRLAVRVSWLPPFQPLLGEGAIDEGQYRLTDERREMWPSLGDEFEAGSGMGVTWVSQIVITCP